MSKNSVFALGLAACVLFAWARPAASQSAGKDEVQPWIKMGNTGIADDLYAISAVSKTSVWFAGNNGVVLHWNGRIFRSYKVELPDNVILCDIHMFSDSDGWAVGYNAANGYGRIYHWDGRAWKLATAEGIKGFQCRAIAFLGPQDGLFVGCDGELWRWDGRVWLGQDWSIFGPGGSIDAGRVSEVIDVMAVPDQGVYVISCNFKRHDRVETGFIRLNLRTYPYGEFFNTPIKNQSIHSHPGRIFHVPGGKSYYLHEALYAFDESVSAYQKAGIRQFNPNLNYSQMLGLWMFGQDDGWLVGTYGAIVHLKPGPSSKTYWVGSEFLCAIWMHDPDFGFIACQKGTVLMRNTAAAIDVEVNADKLEYDYGAPVFAQVYRPASATPVSLPLAGAQWEVKKETTVDEQTAVSTIYVRAPGGGGDFLDPNEPLNMTWNQKDGQGRQIGPGVYRIVFHIGDRTPFVRIAIRPPAGSVKAGDAPAVAPGLALDVRDSYPPADIAFKLGNRGKKAVDIVGETYSIALQRAGGWQVFYESGPQSAFRPATIGAGKEYAWVWRRQDTTGRHTAGPGRYRLSVMLPGQTPEQLIKEFDILIQ